MSEESKDAPKEAAPPRKWGWVRDIAIGVGIVLAVQWWRSQGTLSGPIPHLTASLADGSTLELGAPRSAPYILQFGAVWCGVCRMEDGTIRSLAEGHDVILVESQSGPAASVSAFGREHDLTMPTIVDEEGTLAARFGVSAFPTTFFVTAEGEISDVEVGYTTWLGMRARLLWASL